MARDASYVAVYDVSDDRERARLAAVIEAFGLRVQYSAFELRLTPATRQTLLRRIEALALESGYLYLYRRAGGHDRAVAGKPPEDFLAESHHAWVVAEDVRPGPGTTRGARPKRPRTNGRTARTSPAPSARGSGKDAGSRSGTVSVAHDLATLPNPVLSGAFGSPEGNSDAAQQAVRSVEAEAPTVPSAPGKESRHR